MSSRHPSRRSSAVQSNYHDAGPQMYTPSGDILVDSAVDIADSPTHEHPASVEFLYLPSGEILAKPSHVTSTTMPPAMLQMDAPLSDVRYDYAMYPRPPSTSASTMSLREQALSPASNDPPRYTHHRGLSVDTTKPNGHNAYQQRILELETLLQNEKKRSLDKMRLLLDEQDKSHDLQTRFATLQAKVKSLESTIARHDTTTRDLHASLAAANARHASVVVALADKTNEVDRLTHEIETQKSTMTRLLANQSQPSASPPRPKPTLVSSSTQTPPPTLNPSPADSRRNFEAPSPSSRRPPSTQQPDPSAAGVAAAAVDQTASSDGLTAQPDAMDSLLAAIHAWKETADAWCRKSSSAATSSSLDTLLLDFPALPGRAASSSPPSPAKDANATVIAMLKRRLALVDKEYRHTHTKYIELKELCARQCVREADLQNFVNEHRLRGQCNLRLPSTQSSPPLSVASRQEERRPMDGHVKVVIHKRERPTADASQPPVVVSTTVDDSAVRAKLHTMRKQRGHKDDRHPLNVVVHPSRELARRHQRIPTPQAKKATKKPPGAAPPTNPARPWV